MNSKKVWAAGAAGLAAVLLTATQAFAGVTVGNADSGNCYPFSCGPTDGVTEYQEVYNGSAFSGPTTFNQISFTAQDGSVGFPMDSGVYSVSFYLAASSFPTLSSDLASNEGTLLGNFGAFNVSGSMPSSLTLTGSRINYDPTQGALLMDVTIANGASYDGNYNAFFNADYTGSDVQRAWSGQGNTTGALQTTFSAAVPEPATWAMLILGVAMVGFAARRREGLALTA